MAIHITSATDVRLEINIKMCHCWNMSEVSLIKIIRRYSWAIKTADLRSKAESVPAYSVMATYQHLCGGNEF